MHAAGQLVQGQERQLRRARAHGGTTPGTSVGFAGNPAQNANNKKLTVDSIASNVTNIRHLLTSTAPIYPLARRVYLNENTVTASTTEETSFYRWIYGGGADGTGNHKATFEADLVAEGFISCSTSGALQCGTGVCKNSSGVPSMKAAAERHHPRRRRRVQGPEPRTRMLARTKSSPTASMRRGRVRSTGTLRLPVRGTTQALRDARGVAAFVRNAQLGVLGRHPAASLPERVATSPRHAGDAIVPTAAGELTRRAVPMSNLYRATKHDAQRGASGRERATRFLGVQRATSRGTPAAPRRSTGRGGLRRALGPPAGTLARAGHVRAVSS